MMFSGLSFPDSIGESAFLEVSDCPVPPKRRERKPDNGIQKNTFVKENDMENDYRKIAGAFLVGGLVGAAIALLYAPQSGRETRKDITKTARRIKKETVHLVEDAVDSINDFAGDVKDKITDVIERGKDVSDSAKKEIIRNLEQGQKVIEKQRKRIVEALGM
jgi:gas vesicle protein